MEKNINKGPKNAWPANRADFRYKDTEQYRTGALCDYDKPVVVPIPASMFVRNAASFENVDLRGKDGFFLVVGLELFLYAIQIIYLRTDFTGTSDDKPLDVKLEGLADEDGDVVEYRLLIFQRQGTKLSVFKVIDEILKSPSKRINARGYFPDLELKKGGGDPDGDKLKNTEVDPHDLGSVYANLRAHVMYKYLNRRDRIAKVFAVYAKNSGISDGLSNIYKGEGINQPESPLFPGRIFNLATILSNTSFSVAAGQRDLSNYWRRTPHPGGETTNEFTFPRPDLVLNIQMEWCSPMYFMTRMFPFIQLRESIVRHDRRVLAIALLLQERAVAEEGRKAGLTKQQIELRVAPIRRMRIAAGVEGPPLPAESPSRAGASTPARNGKSPVQPLGNTSGPNLPGSGDGSRGLDSLMRMAMELEGDDDNDAMMARLCSGKVPPPGSSGNDLMGGDVPISRLASDAHGGKENYSAAMHFGLDLDGMEERMELTADQLAENRALMGIGDEDEDTGAVRDEIDDFLLTLKRQYQVHKHVLTQCFGRDKVRLRLELSALKDIFFEKYECFCMSSMSNVSEVGRTQSRLWEEEGLDDLDSTWHMIDPTMSVMANWLIHMVEGLTVCDVATQHLIIITLFIGLGDRFRREFNLHYNAYIEGENAVGKSAIIQMLCKLFGKETCQEFTAKSTKSGAVDKQKSDVFSFCEDYSLKKALLANGDGEDAIMRNLLTRMMYIYDVFEFRSKDGKNQERTCHRVVGKEIGCQCLGGNETVSEINEDTRGRKAITMGVAAHMSRYHVIDASRHEHPIRNIQRSMAAASRNGRGKAERAVKFRKECLKSDIIRRHFMHLEYIGLVHVKMDAFTDIFPKYIEYFARLGIRPESERIFQLASFFCKQLTILSTYHTNHNVPKARFHGQKFKISQLRDWVPVATPEMVAHTLGHFESSFIPAALPSVLECLRKIKQESLASKDGRVAWESPYDTNKRRMAEHREKTRSRNDKVAANATQFAQNALMGKLGQVQAVGGVRGFMPQMDAGAMPQPGGKRTYEEAMGDQLPGAKVVLDASWLQFRMSEDDLVTQIAAFLNDQTVQHSRGAIKQCLERLRTWRVKSHGYTVLDPHQVDANKVLQSPEASRMAVDTRRGEVFVNTAVLDPDFHYTDTARKCVQSTSFEHTLPQKLMYGRGDPENPWMFQTINVEPIKGRPMYIINPSYVMESSRLAMMGGASDGDPAEKHFIYRFPVDFDSVYLEQYGRSIDSGERESLADIEYHHPLTVMERIRSWYAENPTNPETGSPWEFLEYPNEYKRDVDTAAKIVLKMREAEGISDEDLDSVPFCDILAVTEASAPTADTIKSYRERLALRATSSATAFAKGILNSSPVAASEIEARQEKVDRRVRAKITEDHMNEDLYAIVMEPPAEQSIPPVIRPIARPPPSTSPAPRPHGKTPRLPPREQSFTMRSLDLLEEADDEDGF